MYQRKSKVVPTKGLDVFVCLLIVLMAIAGGIPCYLTIPEVLRIDVRDAGNSTFLDPLQ